MSRAERTVRVKPRETAGVAGSETVSVVIPCYNYGRFLGEAVGSALSQRSADVRVIVVDDRSTDDSLAVATAIADRDPRVTVIANERNSGMVETFNRGLRAAAGDFLVRLDADDLLTPGALERALAVFRAYPSVGLVYGHPLHFEGTRLPEPRTAATAWTVWPGRRWLADRCASGVNVITSPEVVMRMSTVREAGPQMPLKHTPDMEMWLRLAAFADVAYIQGADQAWHREHAASMSATEVDDVVDLVERGEAFEVLFSGPVGRLPEAEELHAAALTALAREALMRAAREYDRGRGNSPAAAEFIRLAGQFIPDTARVSGWRRLQRRIRRGSRFPQRSLQSLGARLARRTASELKWRRWRREGVF
ncbi:glycosyltransferase family A protein [Sinomonas sp. ASV322]|uniref:glycosyltransferase family 2 protein n=1 Tax=Sinomonas sp. ASV322 TaxID=3041920 RepID=UPI0027DC9C10|nr:glycosyltransferase family A protein [Sinomonas sp. ASV322]MDQ4504339.1 glycosyltransferase family A protein [Sinomonas sp. ASV322]